jgi:phosphoribosylglycinamide formyltransferase 1
VRGRRAGSPVRLAAPAWRPRYAVVGPPRPREAWRATSPLPHPPRARVVVLVSGAGSNMVALADAVARGEVAADVVAVISDVADAPALARANGVASTPSPVPFDRTDRPGWEAGSPTRRGPRRRPRRARRLHADPQRRVPRSLARPRRQRAPSLLPAFRGADAVGDALAAGVDTTGVTVHLVDELVDHGPILAQEAVPIAAGRHA